MTEHLKPYEFKPGESGNPNGRPPGAGKEIRKYTRQLIGETVTKLLEQTCDELEETAKRKDTPAIEATVARVILKCKSKGEFTDLDRILDRIIGKVPQKFEGEFGGPGGIPLTPPVFNFIGVSPLAQPPS